MTSSAGFNPASDSDSPLGSLSVFALAPNIAAPPINAANPIPAANHGFASANNIILPIKAFNAPIIATVPTTIDLTNNAIFATIPRATIARSPFKIGGRKVTMKSLNPSTAFLFLGSLIQSRSLVTPHPIRIAPRVSIIVCHILVTGCSIFLIGAGIPIPFAPASLFCSF